METTQTVIETHDAAEYRRLLAWRMYTQGHRQKDIAETLCVTQGAISQWIKRARDQGAQSLRTRKAIGRLLYLTRDQKEQIPHLLQKGAEHYGFRGDVWTRARVATVIARAFSVSYSHAHISKLLKEIGWTYQKPVRQASQQDAEAVLRWKEETLPALKRGTRRRSNSPLYR